MSSILGQCKSLLPMLVDSRSSTPRNKLRAGPAAWTARRSSIPLLSCCCSEVIQEKEVRCTCRGAVASAVSLSQLPLAALGPSTATDGQHAIPQAHASLVRAVLACQLAQLLLRYTALAVQQGCQLEPAAVFRLASCASVAARCASSWGQRLAQHRSGEHV